MMSGWMDGWMDEVRIVSTGDNKDDITDDYDQKYGWLVSNF
jgi:hypothetical protein